MKAYAEEHNIMAQPRRSLIRSMKGENMLLATPLLKWYLEHGLEVTKVHQVIEFTPEPCLKPFGMQCQTRGEPETRVLGRPSLQIP